jgi:hypothetical protein
MGTRSLKDQRFNRWRMKCRNAKSFEAIYARLREQSFNKLQNTKKRKCR